jgi:precorrin-6Y C5,15-methyltransferase (decarboxylating)
VSLPVHILGIGAAGVVGLSPRARAALARATFLAGGTRHLALIATREVETFTIKNNLLDLVARLRARGPDERCVVLASGDPLCFGIGAFLRAHLGPEALIIEPAVSSLQLAFARAALPWQDAAIASIHGRPLVPTLLPLLGRSLIGLFTEDGDSPARVAEFFLERGLDDYTVWVGENLGAEDERVTCLPIRELIGRSFGTLNVLILQRLRPVDSRMIRLAIPPDHAFAQPETGPVLLTHAEVRAIVLSRFHDLPEGPLWDIGAGLGGIAVGLARLFDRAEIVAVERSPAQIEFLEANRRRFEAWNVRIVMGEAPEVLAGEDAPAGAFLGGSGGRLDAILDVIFDRLRPGGVLVANFVGLQNLLQCVERLDGVGWTRDVRLVQISQGQELAGLTTFAPRRPVWVVRAVRA